MGECHGLGLTPQSSSCINQTSSQLGLSPIIETLPLAAGITTDSLYRPGPTEMVTRGGAAEMAVPDRVPGSAMRSGMHEIAALIEAQSTTAAAAPLAFPTVMRRRPAQLPGAQVSPNAAAARVNSSTVADTVAMAVLLGGWFLP